MTPDELQKVKAGFKAYARSFFNEADEKQQALMDLKWKHTLFVAELAREIAERSGWDNAESNRAEAAGILHDTGRFSQIREFRTFHDKTTVDHGERGFEEADEHGLCAHLDPELQAAMLATIRYHNRRVLPQGLPDEHYKYLKVVRDADRLDIYRVVNHALKSGDNSKHPEITRGINQKKQASPAVVKAIKAGEQVDYDLVQTLTDRMLLQLSWLNIMSHQASLEIFHERGYLNIMAEHLPDEPGLTEIVDDVRMLLQAAHQGS
ncbi:HD domain-containing protein [Verrucomicrobiota bacterium]